MKLKYEDIIDFKKWTRAISLGSAICVGLFVLLQCVAALIHLCRHPQTAPFSVWCELVILPGVISMAAIGLMIPINRHLCMRKRYWIESVVTVTAITVVMFMVVFTHYKTTGVYAVFILPILASLIFIDTRPVTFALLANASAYLLFVLVLLPGKADAAAVGVSDILVHLLVLFLCAAGSAVILRVISSLIENIILKNTQLRTDSFTRLLNHTSFYEYLGAMLGNPTLQNPALSMIIWDIDDLKEINEAFGHDMGDKVILCFATVLKAKAVGQGYAFRYGGEEFVALLQRDAEGAMDFANDVRQTFKSASYRLLPARRSITASAGVCVYEQKHFRTGGGFFSATYEALYQAKGFTGKDTTCLWNPEHHRKIPARRKGDLLGGAR